MDLTDYEPTAHPIDDKMRPNASQAAAAAHRARETETEEKASAPSRLPFAIGALVVALLTMAAISWHLAQPPARPLQMAPTDVSARAFGTDPKVSHTASPAPSTAPTATEAPTFTPVPTAAPPVGRGLGIVQEVTAAPPEPSYISNVGAQAPHTPRGGVTGPCDGACAIVPTISAEQAVIIGRQAPHKVR